MIFFGIIALMVCFASCDKSQDGEYHPSKKIEKIFKVNEDGEASLSQVWHWDGDILTSIDNYYGLLSLTDHFTYDEKSRLTRIENGSSHSEFFYDGKEMRTVLIYQGEDQVARYDFEYKGRKISVIKMEIEDDIFDLFKRGDLSVNPLSILFPEVGRTAQPIIKQYARDAKGPTTLTLTLHWDGHNVKTLDIAMDGFFGLSTTATAECTFDSKRNPFKGFFSMLSGGSNPMETAFCNHNNLLTVSTHVGSMMNAMEENSYEYEGNYPVKVVSKMTSGTSILGDEETEVTTTIYEYLAE